EAAVIGVPNESHGEEVKAVVAFKAGKSAATDEIIAYCKEKLAAYKYPRIVEIVDALPKGPTGRTLKRELRYPPPGAARRRTRCGSAPCPRPSRARAGRAACRPRSPSACDRGRPRRRARPVPWRSRAARPAASRRARCPCS